VGTGARSSAPDIVKTAAASTSAANIAQVTALACSTCDDRRTRATHPRTGNARSCLIRRGRRLAAREPIEPAAQVDVGDQFLFKPGQISALPPRQPALLRSLIHGSGSSSAAPGRPLHRRRFSTAGPAPRLPYR
jgi:hypothetical protein